MVAKNSALRETPPTPPPTHRSQRAIKPTKDIDLYLLSAQFGVCLEESDADSSDMEFAVEDEKEEGVCVCACVCVCVC